MTYICLYIYDSLTVNPLTEVKNGDLLETSSRDKSLVKNTQRICEQTNLVLLHWLKSYPQFSLNFSWSSDLLKQAFEKKPWLNFVEISQHQKSEFLAQTFDTIGLYGYSGDEFAEEVKRYLELLKSNTDREATVFHSKHLYFGEQIVKELYKLGFKAAVSSHSDFANMWQHPDFVYQSRNNNVKVLIQNQSCSYDLLKLSELNQLGLIESFVERLEDAGEVVNLFLDYHSILSGVDFLENFITTVEDNDELQFTTVSHLLDQNTAISSLDMPTLTDNFGSRIVSSPLDAFFLKYSPVSANPRHL